MAEWCFACPDWKDRLKQRRSLVPDLPLNKKEAERAVRLFDRMRIPDVPGQPRMREAAGQWQRDIVAALFGSIDETGRRWVKKPFVLVPKKNSKTTGGAAIMLTAMLMDQSPKQTYLIFAPSHSISELAFNAAQGMIEADETLSKRFHPRPHIKTIEDLRLKSTLQIKTFDSSVATGVKPKGILLDELHELGRVHYAERVMQQLTGGLMARRDGFMVVITTQSDDQPAGVFKQQLDLARRIRDGRIEGEAALSTLPVLYEFPEEFQTDPEQPWRNPQYWPMVLPNLGRSVHVDLLQQDFAEAQEKGDSALRIWASQHLNIEIGLGLHANRWRGADYWEAAAEPDLTLEALLDRCEVAVCGIDGGGSDDLFGLSVVGRERETGVWLAWCHAWVLRKVLDIRKDIAPRLLDFERDGDLTICDSGQDMVQDIATYVEQVRDSGLFPDKHGVGTDPSDIGSLLDALNAIGIADEEIAPVFQGVRLSSAIGAAEFKLHDRMLRHDGSAMMAWCVGNAKAVLKGNSLTIDKEISGSGKIDPLIAMLSAVKLMDHKFLVAASAVSAYETRDLLVI